MSRRALLGGLACFGSVLALGGCADLGATAPRFDASALSVDPTLLVATTRKHPMLFCRSASVWLAERHRVEGG
jgi:hypothetical protein